MAALSVATRAFSQPCVHAYPTLPAAVAVFANKRTYNLGGHLGQDILHNCGAREDHGFRRQEF
jgi:hypothetical protein